ncbi:MAG: trehalose-phosphatase [Candidatus Omnitrophota bacterium]
MKHLAREWNSIKRNIKGKPVYLFLDFDGTLTPIRKRPEAVKLSKATREAIKKLASQKKVFTAIISGRALKEVKKLVDVKGVMYAGNHGLEAEGAGFKFTAPEARKSKKTITEVKNKLRKNLSSFKGVLVEDKGLSFSVHFRMADRDKAGQIERTFRKITNPYKASGKIVVTKGKKVWEVRPPVKWDKGRIVSLLLKQRKKSEKKEIIPFYIGDDRTDEDAFRALGKRAYTVTIGKTAGKNTLARYYLMGTKEVREFLKKVSDIKSQERS